MPPVATASTSAAAKDEATPRGAPVSHEKHLAPPVGGKQIRLHLKDLRPSWIVAIVLIFVLGAGATVWFLNAPREYEVSITAEVLDNVTFSSTCQPVARSAAASANALEIAFDSGSSQEWVTASGTWTSARSGNCVFSGVVQGPRNFSEYSARLTTTTGGARVFIDSNQFDRSTGIIRGRGDVTVYEKATGSISLIENVSSSTFNRCKNTGNLNPGGTCGRIEILRNSQCQGAGSWEDINRNTFIRVSRPDGVEISAARLGVGIGARESQWEEVSRNTIQGKCVFTFSLDIPRHTDGYVFDTTGRGGVTYTLEDVESKDWVIELSLGPR